MQRFSNVLLIIFLIGCVPQPINTPEPTSLTSTASEAQQALIKFFSLLKEKKYGEAISLYGGSYEQLQIFDPEINPADQVALWEWVCESRILQCLTIRTATFKNLEGDTYVFRVEFNNSEGSLFVLGPCCGANETEMPPVSQFEYKVTRDASGQFVVMDLPPYVP
ncbi:MAG TPA: hypothetical protein VGA72_05635 [Anaerolineales bacterium]